MFWGKQKKGHHLPKPNLDDDTSSNLINIPNLPLMEYGAPCPHITASEHELTIEYNAVDAHEVSKNVSEDAECSVIFRMTGVRCFSQDTNSEWHTGVYGGDHEVCELENSSKNFRLFQNETKKDFKHLIFAFHDTSVECICKEYEVYLRDHTKNITIPVLS